MTAPSPGQASDQNQVGALEPTAAFAQLGTMLHDSEEPLGQVLQRVAELTKRLVPELDDVSVTLLEGREARSVAFTGRLAADLDERQYEAGFGPCLDAAFSGQTVKVDTGDPSGLYVEFARTAASRGVTHVLSVGMPIPQHSVGGLNLYSTTAHAISVESVVLAEQFAGYAAVALTNSALYHSAVDLAGHMQAAMKTRAVIEQAKGIVMATRHCTSDQAFALLTRASQQQNRKLNAIAAGLVARATGAPPQERT